MTLCEIAKKAAERGCVGLRFQKSERARYRDRITIYRDGSALFERFCYGEAAGMVFNLKASGANGESGAIAWDYDACANSGKNEAPKCITGGDENALLFDGKSTPWELSDALKTDGANGWGLFAKLFKK